MAKFTIIGKCMYSESDETEDGMVDMEINEVVEIDGTPREALECFFDANTQYSFSGKMILFDDEANGNSWATFKDKDNGYIINVDQVSTLASDFIKTSDELVRDAADIMQLLDDMDVEAEQNFSAETTTYHFDDGSKIMICGSEVTVK